MVEANDGGFVLAGYSESNDFDITDNHGSYDYWVVKINNVGELVWKKSYGGSEIDQAYGIVKTNNNTYLVAGISNSLDFDISSNIDEIKAILDEFRDDFNQQHFIRDKEFIVNWQFFDEKINNLLVLV